MRIWSNPERAIEVPMRDPSPIECDRKRSIAIHPHLVTAGVETANVLLGSKSKDNGPIVAVHHDIDRIEEQSTNAAARGFMNVTAENRHCWSTHVAMVQRRARLHCGRNFLAHIGSVGH